MRLRFLGTGGAFAPTHTNAWFREGEDLFFLDLSMLHAREAAQMVGEDTREVYVLLTHMHDDHCSGIGLFAEWCWFLCGRSVSFVADPALRKDLEDYLRIIGVTEEMFRILDPSECPLPLQMIPTRHTPALAGKCFGFCLETGGKRVVYTGDTATLEPFLPYLEEGAELYTETAYRHGLVHLLWEEQKTLLLALSDKCSVCLMHMDDPEALRRETEGTGILLACDLAETDGL